MDLLGSILGNMEKPPALDEKQKKKNKEHQKKMKELEEKEQEEKLKFRKDIDRKISEFMKNKNQPNLRFPPMNKVQRSIIHDIAEIANLISHSFGHEGEDGRYLMLFRKDNPPCDEELNAYKQGKEWDPNNISKEDKKLQPEDPKQTKSTSKIEPTFNYKDKYSHLIGKDSAKSAAKKTEANKTFGMVPSASKRDMRSVEETMNELREKRRKIEKETQ